MQESRAPAPPLDRFFELALAGMMACGYIAVAISGTLDIPTLAIAGAAILLRSLMAAGLVRFRVPELAVTLIAIAYFGFYPIDYQFLSRRFLPATVHLVFVLSSLLLLRASTRRDFTLLKLVAFVEILAAGILTGRVTYLLFLGIFLLCGIAVQMSDEIRGNLAVRQRVARSVARGLPLRLGSLSVAVLAGVLVVAGGMFFALPRTARAALQHLAPDRYRLPGFSNEVRLGQIGEILQSHATVMHVQIDDPTAAAGLKFRGSALSEFDGHRWFNEVEDAEKLPTEESGHIRLNGHMDANRDGRHVAVTVQLTDSTGDVLFMPGLPEFLQIDSEQVLRTAVDGYRTGSRWAGGMRYNVYSLIEKGPPVLPVRPLGRFERGRDVYLETPPMDARIQELAVRLTARLTSPAAKASAIEHYLRTSFIYSLELPRQVPLDPIADFLFVRRKGHCEYFASAMAVMLRTIGIPSRVATGFQNGEYNPVTGWYVIRASDAHSWVEARVDDLGWHTYDPTPPAIEPPAYSWMTKLRNYTDAAELFWQEWVLAYDLNHQFRLADKMSRSGRDFSIDWSRRWDAWRGGWKAAENAWSWRWTALLLSLMLSVAAGLTLGPRLLLLWQRRKHAQRVVSGHVDASDATLLYERMLEQMRKRGWERPLWMTPLEFSQKLPQSGESTRLVADFTASYNALRFGGHREAALRMIALLGRLESAQ